MEQRSYFKGLSYLTTYNNYSNTQDAVLCHQISKYVKEGTVPSVRIYIREKDRKLSLNTPYHFEFNGCSIQELSAWIKEFQLGNSVYAYSSLKQYLVHQKTLLFLDREKAAEVLGTRSPEELELLNRSISNYDESIWREYAVRIMQTGILTLCEQSHQFKTDLADAEEGVFYSLGLNKRWNISSVNMSIEDMLIPKRNNEMNILGKVLTLCKIDHI